MSKQLALTAVGVAVGGAIGGREGALAGGIAGSIAGYLISDDYKSMLKVLRNLSDVDREKLVQKVHELVRGHSKEALDKFITYGGRKLRESLIGLLLDYANAK